MSSIGANDRGFTLLELLIVLAVLAMTSALALTMTSGLTDHLTVTRAADSTEQALSRAAAKATMTGRDQIISLEIDEARSRLKIDDAAVELAPDLTVKWTAVGEAGTSRHRARIAFFGAGGASGGTIAFVKGTSEAKLEIDWLTGKVRRQQDKP